MASQDTVPIPLLPVALSLSQLLSPGEDYLQNFFDVYSTELSPSCQGELDELLGFQMRCDPCQLYSRHDHQNDPHLFLRVCFFLIGRSFPALQAWVALYRLGFECDLHWNGNETVDVSVFQSRHGYNIRMEVRLKDATMSYHAPGWLSDNPLSVPLFDPLYDTQCAFPTSQLGEASSSTHDHVPNFQKSAHESISTSPLDFAPKDTQDTPVPLDAAVLCTLRREPTLLNEQNLTASRPPSGFSWLADYNTTDSNHCGHLAVSRSQAMLKEGLLYAGQAPNLDDIKSNDDSPLMSTPTNLNETTSAITQPSFHFSSDAKPISGTHTVTFTHIPTLLNPRPLFAAQSYPGLLESSAAKITAAVTHLGTDGLRRSNTPSRIRASDEHPTVGISAQNKQDDLNTGSDASWEMSSQEGRGSGITEPEEVGVRKVQQVECSLSLTNVEERLEDLSSDGQVSHGDLAAPSEQEVSDANMDVDPHPSGPEGIDN